MTTKAFLLGVAADPHPAGWAAVVQIVGDLATAGAVATGLGPS
ncbi:MAG: hypothetical protein R3258_00225 [Acidimicrobiia bacterium]|nr:hypothetical protein [Acidimicrobiia bacterium]